MWKKIGLRGAPIEFLDQGNLLRILRKTSMHYVALVGIKTFYSRMLTYCEKVSEKCNFFVNKAD